MECCLQEPHAEAQDVSEAVQTQLASAQLQDAAAVVCEHVNQLAGRVKSSLAEDDRCSLWQHSCYQYNVDLHVSCLHFHNHEAISKGGLECRLAAERHMLQLVCSF